MPLNNLSYNLWYNLYPRSLIASPNLFIYLFLIFTFAELQTWAGLHWGQWQQ